MANGLMVSGTIGRAIELLLVEDNPGDIRLIVDALAQARLLHNLRVADNGSSALAMLRREGPHQNLARPDLILLDLNLPGLSGHEVLHALKSDQALARIPVIVLSGSCNHDDIVRAYAAHASCHLCKPVDGDQLLGVMQSVGGFLLSMTDQPQPVSAADLHGGRVLLVEDNEGDARLVREMLAPEHIEVVTVTRLKDALSALDEGTFVAALVDPGLPDSSGMDTIHELLRAAPLLPLVVLSGQADEALALRAVQLGAQDYVVKGRLRDPALLRALRFAVERKQVQERLDYLSSHDGLTGLPNRHVFLQELVKTVAHSHRHRQQVGVMVLRLSGVGLVNQLHGHEIGDVAIRAAVERTRALLPAGTTLACTAAGEFSIIVADGHAIAKASQLAREIIHGVGHPDHVGDRVFYLGSNIGISLFPGDAENPLELLKCAETALYQAKSMARDSFRFYSASMNAAALERQGLEHELRHALQRGEFELFYQPVFDVSSGDLQGGEALLRWRHPQRGLLAPEVFLDIVEQTGLIREVGAWVLTSACHTAQAWPSGRRGPLQLAVNVSAQQVAGGGFVCVVDAALTASGLAPERLVVELTESMMQSDTARDALHELRRRQVKIAIDDFGTGFSSLAYLRRFTVDVLKIDRSFLHGIPADERDAAMVRTIVTMARNFGLAVVAEGVETQAQLRFLQELGCDSAQGFLWREPMTADAFCQFVRTQSG